jgi:signal transduction histidine kinase
MSKKFLERLGAKIQAESEIGRATTFIIDLPKEK